MRRPQRLVLLGHPVAHSLSPRIHNAALAAAGIAAHYEALDVEPAAFAGTLEQLRSEGAAGNVTIPHKERMFKACDVLTPLARHVGAVNTFWFEDDGQLVGDNTDVGGFDSAVRAFLGARPHDITVGVLGAGGGAAGVLAAIEQWPRCEAFVHNRTPERAELLCARFGSFAHAVDDAGVIAGTQLVINATSVGLTGDSVPIPVLLLQRDTPFFDLVYRASDTPFTRALRSRGIRYTDGRAMLVEQAALAFEKWFGVSPNRQVMHNASFGH